MRAANKSHILRKRKKEEDARGGKKRRALADDGEKKPDPILEMCESVMEDVKKFKVHIPLISIMCNPGIRDRHWVAMSELYGDDLTPDAGTTLRKMLKKNLDPFMSDFETISGGASKVRRREKSLLFSRIYRTPAVSVLRSLTASRVST